MNLVRVLRVGVLVVAVTAAVPTFTLVVTAPVVTAPVVRAPVVRAPMVRAPMVAGPAITAPVVASPLFAALVAPLHAQTVIQENVSSPRRSRRRSRRGRRGRYPGPIPTPSQWEAPTGPIRIGLQAGHWKADEAPSELSGLKDNGTRWNGTAEWEVNLEIARTTGKMLEGLGYLVDILPAVVPASYRAHLFIAIHADGSTDPNASGYRVAAPRRDATGRAQGMVALLERSHGEATGIRHLPTVTRRMSNYYAFNFRRYEHALHPMTIAVILETGFLTSPADRQIIMNDPDRVARGIVEAVTAFPVTPPPGTLGGR